MNKTKKDTKTPWLLYALLSCVGVTAVWGWLPWILHDKVPNLERSGQIGDTFGVVNALFTALAFALLIITALMQRQELELQREELQSTREEIRKSAEAQKELVRLSTEQLALDLRTRKTSIEPRLRAHESTRYHELDETYTLGVEVLYNPCQLLSVKIGHGRLSYPIMGHDLRNCEGRSFKEGDVFPVTFTSVNIRDQFPEGLVLLFYLVDIDQNHLSQTFSFDAGKITVSPPFSG